MDNPPPRGIVPSIKQLPDSTEVFACWMAVRIRVLRTRFEAEHQLGARTCSRDSSVQEAL